MNIYPSTEVYPYVYIGVNKETGQFYIGYREKNTQPSHIDLYEYRTSSNIVSPIFDNLDWTIMAEFFNGNDAFDFEQKLIYENWGNPLLLNENVRLPNGNKRFKAKKGCGKGKTISIEHRAVVSRTHKDKPKSKIHKDRISRALKETFKKTPKTKPTHTTPHSEETKEKMRGPRGPQSLEVIAAKIARMTGRKRGPYKKKNS